MRPPLNAGENPAAEPHSAFFRKASMRPPLNAGENPAAEPHSAFFRKASMRPPLNAGENNLDLAGAYNHLSKLQ